jgi:UDP-N-acetylmuramate--alanine ligase
VYNTLLDQTSGAIFYCIDDPGAASLCSNRPGAISFGAAENARYRFTNVRPKGFSAEFSVYREDALLGQVTLGVPGQHNVSNATGVIALATELGVEFSRIQEALSSFRGARRRFEVKYASPNYLVLDDYAHHPTEIRMTLATARAGASGRVKAMFQPHRYSRTKALQKEFGGSFGDADAVFVTDVYPASEPPIEGVTGELIANAITAAGHPSVTYEPDIAKLHFAVGNRLQPGDTLISLGAGNIHEASALIGRDLQVLDRLREAMGSGVAKLYEPMARHTTLRIGGPAQYWLEPETEEGFARIVRLCRSERLPLMVVGRGSNLLVRDGGIRGVVVHPERGEFGKIKISGTEIEVGVGVKFRQISAAAKNAGIGGFEWMEGIPGNAGGGIRMNAGAMGSQTFDQVIEVRYLDSAGLIHTARPDELDVQYRNVPYFKDHYALSVRLRGYRSDPGEIAKRIDAALDKRKTTQPAAASAGCIFKNPAECPAGKLVDELGMKDFTVGGARVSGVHANFVVNDGGAKCADVITIIETIRGLARKDRGINLETEVQIVGEENPY